ncbi:MAG: hypothetical protein Q8N05_15035 [Bacteroidota bacterium]|nr:hypothetical protein [Bacteroidota bacterium]
MIPLIQQKGCILPIVRRKFENGFLTDTHGSYPTVVRQLANVWNVTLVDLQLLTAGAITAIGERSIQKNVSLGSANQQVSGRSKG